VLRRFGDWDAKGLHAQFGFWQAAEIPFWSTAICFNPHERKYARNPVFLTDSTIDAIWIFSLHCLLYQRQRLISGLNSIIAKKHRAAITRLYPGRRRSRSVAKQFHLHELQPNFNVVARDLRNATSCLVKKKRSDQCHPGDGHPLRDGLDEISFDYESQSFQVNYLQLIFPTRPRRISSEPVFPN